MYRRNVNGTFLGLQIYNHLNWKNEIDQMISKLTRACYVVRSVVHVSNITTLKSIYEGRTESHEQLFFACELGTADEGECGGRWNQLLCYP